MKVVKKLILVGLIGVSGASLFGCVVGPVPGGVVYGPNYRGGAYCRHNGCWQRRARRSNCWVNRRGVERCRVY